MKGIPIKRNWKTIIFILTRGVWSSPYVSLLLSFASPPLCPSALPPSPPLILVCFVMCSSCGSVFYVLWLLHLAFPLLWPVREQPINFSVYSWCCWLSHTVSLLVGLFIFTFLFRCLSLDFSLHFQLRCVCAAVISSSPETMLVMVNTVQNAQYLASRTFCSH